MSDPHGGASVGTRRVTVAAPEQQPEEQQPAGGSPTAGGAQAQTAGGTGAGAGPSAAPQPGAAGPGSDGAGSGSPAAGVPAPARLAGRLQSAFVGGAFTRVTRLQLTGLRAGTAVRVRCRGKGWPFRSKRATVRRGTSVLNQHCLPPGAATPRLLRLSGTRLRRVSSCRP